MGDSDRRSVTLLLLAATGGATLLVKGTQMASTWIRRGSQASCSMFESGSKQAVDLIAIKMCGVWEGSLLCSCN